MVIVATKPTVVSTALNSIKHLAAGKLFLSVAMGITIGDLEKVNYKINIYIIKFQLYICVFSRVFPATHVSSE